MSRKGYIPPEVHFFTKPKQTLAAVSGHWWRLQHRLEVECQPAFPVSSLLKPDAATWDNAKQWATPYVPRPRASLRDAMQGRVTPPAPQPDPTPTILPNDPKGGYRIVGAEQRGEGGRAWKVLSPEGFLVDLREDVFMPILLREGLPKTGIIPAEFQWCVNGSQIRLEEVGSTAHGEYTLAADMAAEKARRAAEAKAKRAKVQYVGVRDLEVGGVYKFSVFGEHYRRVYLGRLRVNGKIKTVWMPVSHRGAHTHQERFDQKWAEANRHDWSHTVVLSTGSKALERLGGDVTPPEDWQKAALTFERGDGMPAEHEPTEFNWL